MAKNKVSAKEDHSYEDGYATVPPKDEESLSLIEESPSLIEEDTDKAVTTDDLPAQSAEEAVAQAVTEAANDPFWQRAKAIYTALEVKGAYIFVSPVQASHSKKINPHTYKVGMKSPGGLVTVNDLQAYLDRHDGNVKVVSLQGFVAEDEESNPFPGVDVFFELN